jgi:hypothetical protein
MYVTDMRPAQQTKKERKEGVIADQSERQVPNEASKPLRSGLRRASTLLVPVRHAFEVPACHVSEISVRVSKLVTSSGYAAA